MAKLELFDEWNDVWERVEDDNGSYDSFFGKDKSGPKTIGDVVYGGFSADEICKECLEEGAKILEESVRKEVEKEIFHEGDSELAKSFKANKPTTTINGEYIVHITPKGESRTKKYRITRNRGGLITKSRKYPIKNALKAIWKEYGIPGKQAPTPFLGRATRNVEKKVVEKMQEIYERKMGLK